MLKIDSHTLCPIVHTFLLSKKDRGLVELCGKFFQGLVKKIEKKFPSLEIVDQI